MRITLSAKFEERKQIKILINEISGNGSRDRLNERHQPKNMSLSPVLSATSVRGTGNVPSPLVLHLSAASESEYESTLNPTANTPTSRQPVIVNGKLLLNPQRIYKCTFEGCDKSYSKPSRLEEHERSHTGHVMPIDWFRIVELKFSQLAPVCMHDVYQVVSS